MKIFGFGKGRKKEEMVEDSIWSPISKAELQHRFSFPKRNDEILVVDENYRPVWYFRTYYYASAWEYYEIGRSVSVFADNEKKEIFREDADNIGEYQYEDASFGTKANVMEEIEALPENIYVMSCGAFEDFVNRNQRMSWQHHGMTLHAGDQVHVKRCTRGDGAEYVDAAGRTAMVLYRFHNGQPAMKFDEEIQNSRVFRDGIHTITICGLTAELPLTDGCVIEKQQEVIV